MEIAEWSYAALEQVDKLRLLVKYRPQDGPQGQAGAAVLRSAVLSLIRRESQDAEAIFMQVVCLGFFPRVSRVYTAVLGGLS